jgi:hypothetical protein
MAIFVVFLVASLAVGGTLAYRSNRLFKKDPHAHYEKITGRPWPPWADRPPGPTQPP